jgi:hypothetical protein
MVRVPLTIVLIVVIAGIQPARSQPALPAFGTIDIADLQMKECSFEKGCRRHGIIRLPGYNLRPGRLYNADNYRKKGAH